jgi:hypothetical protein
MIGRHSGNQDWLFYAFNLDDHVPSNHLLRGDRFGRSGGYGKKCI